MIPKPSKPFLANFASICHACSLPIEIGQSITWDRSPRAPGQKNKRSRHVSCSDPWHDGDRNHTATPYRRRKRSNAPAVGPAEIVNIIADAPRPKPTTPTEVITAEAPPDYLAGLAAALEPYLKGKLDSKVDTKQLEELETRLNVELGKRLDTLKGDLLEAVSELRQELARKLKEAGGGVLTIEVQPTNGGDPVTIKGAHKVMPRLLDCAAARMHAYLFGPPGSGKSTGAHQVSKALDLPFGYISLNPQTPESRILGYRDAAGNYQGTRFRTIYESGGVFCIDELDNASGALLTTLNSFIENGLGAFPDGMIERHADFVLIATGNTNGRGANMAFPERRALDAAFLDRFAFLPWGYDEALELAIAVGNFEHATPWVEYVRRVRAHCLVHHPRVFVTPRASQRGAILLKHTKWTAAEIQEAMIFRGLDKATTNSINRAVPVPNARDLRPKATS